MKDFKQNNTTQFTGNNGQFNRQPQKPPKKTVSLKAVIIACICTAAVAIGGSIGGFAAIANTGVFNKTETVTVTQTEAGTATPVAATTTVKTNTTAEDLSAVTEKAMKSVVLIKVYQKSSGNSLEDYFNYYYGGGYGGYGGYGGNYGNYGSYGNQGGNQQEQTEELYSEGSGVIATQDGYVITNAHVVANGDSVKVVLQNDETYDAKVIGKDTVNDVALLKIDATGLDAADFGSSENLKTGERVIALGNPGGSSFESSATYGFISNPKRQLQSSTGNDLTLIQTDAAVNPGNSGGALTNAAGQVIGITSSKIASTEYEGICFAIPIDTVLPIISDIRENGSVTQRGVIGISGQFLDKDTAAMNNLPMGYYVASVNSDNAKKAGLQKGDVITKIDDTEITQITTLQNYLNNKKEGDKVKLTISRNNDTIELEVKLSAST